MTKILKREKYLKELIDYKDDGDIKIITGPRRSGKSWLLNRVYRDYLLKNGVKEENIISINFDQDEYKYDFNILEKEELKSFLYSHIRDKENYYIFLDEIQELKDFERLVNGLNSHDNIDIYITGSNSKFLSSDIKTIFRGRSEDILVYPLTFKEFLENNDVAIEVAWQNYMTFGGMPRLIHYNDDNQKMKYLQKLWEKTYFTDVIERNRIRNPYGLELITDNLCSNISSLTNPHKISNTLLSKQKLRIDSETVAAYIKYLENAFLFTGASRYDVKGKKYFETLKKFYCIDVGLRNARLNFRQQEPTHLMENIIYNYLLYLGFKVDVGVIEVRKNKNDRLTYSQLEIDFVAKKGDKTYYIQSAYAIPDLDKMEQELASLRAIKDSFKKIVVRGENLRPYTNEDGTLFIGIFDFLLSDSWYQGV